MASKVYFTNMRTYNAESLPEKITRLIKTAGIGEIDFKNKFTAVKVHFGEAGNLAYLRPNYAKAVVDVLKELGAKPFVTDCSTLYVGARKNALDHLDVAYEHGYNPFCLGCHVIIADGLKGTDETIVPIEGEFVKNAKIGTAVADADIIISLSHFKGHEGTGFGGALKNLGMGCGSSAGKAEMHESEKPVVDKDKCVACGVCAKNCAHGAIDIKDRASIDYDKCKGCGRCIGVCPEKAMKPGEENGCETLARKVTEYAWAVVKDKPHFHISLAIDISPFCDCYDNNDAPILPDIGMFASFDPVALDKACADMCNKACAIENSLLGEKHHHDNCNCGCKDHFHVLHPDTNWLSAIEQGEKIGLGTREYELIDIG
ncbi:MAG: DUF362 domain-containing protein [Clostridia bacterium]|nr:DUF362 domain-containing protein [Clostridia bacterium]